MKIMKKLLIASLVLLAQLAYAQELPKNTNELVNDFTNTLSAQEKAALTRKLVAYNDSTSTQVAIIIVDTYGNYEPSDFNVRVFDEWKIGQESKDNGILISLAMSDRKMWITSGYGMEDRVTDAASKTIVEEYMKPAFRNGDYYGGLDQATTIIFDLAAGRYKADKIANNSSGQGLGIFGFIIIFIIITIISKIGRIRKHHMGGGSLSFLTIMMLLGSSNRHGGSFGNFNSGGGGFGGGGGGFGGFGGGMTGGGGAGGSW
jgi:uncharacterized protein